MKDMILVGIACVLVGAASALAEGPTLAKEKPVFAGKAPVFKTPGQSSAFAMRLSPDGKHLLYVRAMGEPSKRPEGGVEWQSVLWEPVLRDLSTGGEKTLPLNHLESGWRTVLTRFNPFSSDGTRLILPNIKVETRSVGGGRVCRQSPRHMDNLRRRAGQDRRRRA